jgi:hypothetical protein
VSPAAPSRDLLRAVPAVEGRVRPPDQVAKLRRLRRPLMRRRAVRSAEHRPPGFLIHVNGRFGWLSFPLPKRNKPMKRLIPTAAIMLAASTPAFTQNTEQENDAAMAAVIYMTAQKRCNLTTVEDGKLRGMTISEIERHGLTWEQWSTARSRWFVSS